MISIIILLFSIFLLDQVISRLLIKKWRLHGPFVKYVNKMHEIIERSLFTCLFIIIIFTSLEFPHLRIFIFIGLSTLFGFRTFMLWRFTEEPKVHLLSGIRFTLAILGSITYGIFI
ncbi:DUF4181 domain-containing protein [Evansella tamaricis]|uniref:DUF4181 domain-containing protein n=1 Tax=Evansella tamaricis TaxID=2069301 RepID=A0ABS6JCP5_9BACI|nr:DUF4181 domain-containing protein [Evansella tamaricis]